MMESSVILRTLLRCPPDHRTRTSAQEIIVKYEIEVKCKLDPANSCSTRALRYRVIIRIEFSSFLTQEHPCIKICMG